MDKYTGYDRPINRRIDYLTGERRDMVICSITIEEYKEKIHYEEK